MISGAITSEPKIATVRAVRREPGTPRAERTHELDELAREQHAHGDQRDDVGQQDPRLQAAELHRVLDRQRQQQQQAAAHQHPEGDEPEGA